MVIDGRAYWFARIGLAGILLAVGAGCARRVTRPTDPGVGEATDVDSARAARDERGRSSATQSISFDEKEGSHFARVQQMIEGRFAGVQVIPARGGGYTIRIRGAGSFGSTNEPLLVVDGVPMPSSDLSRIDPRDIQRIDVLKDAAAAIYGVRGANGVIEIRTRRAKR